MDDGLVPPVVSEVVMQDGVLILVVVDDGLVLSTMFSVILKISVLILVVVDDGLVLNVTRILSLVCQGLNPCCSGRWSRTLRTSS